MTTPADARSPDAKENASSLLPGQRLSIGTTGHRLDRLGSERVDQVRVAVETVLAIIEKAARPLANADLRLVTNMADGADSIVAAVAVSHGWTLDAVLPFDRDDYALDFAEGGLRNSYASHLAASSAVLELPGDRSEEGGSESAYERAGRIVLAQSDILIAVWDGGPVRGRGGAAQIIAEAVLQGIPVIHIGLEADTQPLLLWDGLEEMDLGQQTIDTVAKGDIAALPALVRSLLDPPSDSANKGMLRRFEDDRLDGFTAAIAYPLLLAVMGVRRLRRSDFGGSAATEATDQPTTATGSFADHVRTILQPRFARADAAATRVAQLFRNVYVTNFALAALAVVLALMGLALPAIKPVLITLELASIAIILLQTRAGRRAAWHRRWLDNRALAEHLRCLAIGSQLGDLDLRGQDDRAQGWVGWYARATARELGLPSVRIDEAYLGRVRDKLTALIDGQIGYLSNDARRMHHLEHRLHRLGTFLFAATALTCVALMLFKALHDFVPALDPFVHSVTIGATIIGAALPAIGASIYGIRMQGDFAGIAERSEALVHHLKTLRGVIGEDPLSFDTLRRRARRVTGLLTEDLASWLQTYHARPLALPG